MSIKETLSNTISLPVTNHLSQDFACQYERYFQAQFPWHPSTNLINVLRWRFQKCLGTFTMCLSMDPLKWDFLAIYLTTFSESIISKIQNLWGLSFVPKYLKFKLNFKNAAKNREKVFSVWDNCIWIGIVKLSLLRTGYFSSAANVLTSSPKIWHFNNRNFFQINCLGSDQWIW